MIFKNKNDNENIIIPSLISNNNIDIDMNMYFSSTMKFLDFCFDLDIVIEQIDSLKGNNLHEKKLN